MSYIYKIENKINGMVYIGQTNKENPIKRFKEHIRDSRKEKLKHRPLYKDFNKYGIENFSFEILEETEFSDDREIYFIKLYNSTINGYNISLGGKGRKTINHSEKEIIDFYIDNPCIKDCANFFGICTDSVSSILRRNNIEIKDTSYILKNKYSLKVVMIDKITGDEIRIFDSASEAEKMVGNGKRCGHISDVCKGKRKSAFGYLWKYAS